MTFPDWEEVARWMLLIKFGMSIKQKIMGASKKNKYGHNHGRQNNNFEKLLLCKNQYVIKNMCMYCVNLPFLLYCILILFFLKIMIAGPSHSCQEQYLGPLVFFCINQEFKNYLCILFLSNHVTQNIIMSSLYFVFGMLDCNILYLEFKCLHTSLIC